MKTVTGTPADIRAQELDSLGREWRELSEELSRLWSTSHPRTPPTEEVDRIEREMGRIEARQRQIRQETEKDLRPFSQLGGTPGKSFNDVMKDIHEQQNRPPEKTPMQVLEEQVAGLTRTCQQLAARVEELERRSDKRAQVTGARRV